MIKITTIPLESMWLLAQANYNDYPTPENAQVKLELEKRLLEQVNK